MPDANDVQSAGVVVFRPGNEVLLVHRPKYDDWSFPKGKLDRGEHATAAAVREVAEETGLHVRLGPPLSEQRYPVGQRMKTVRYWTGRAVGDDDVSGYLANDEIDEVAWVADDKAGSGSPTPATSRPWPRRSRCGNARCRWSCCGTGSPARARPGDPTTGLRPLLQPGQQQAERLVPVLAAYDVRRVISSSSIRCLQTVAPYAEIAGLEIDETRRLSEEDASAKKVDRIAEAAVEELSTASGGWCSAPIGPCCRWSSTPSAWSTPSWTRARCWWPTCARAGSSAPSGTWCAEPRTHGLPTGRSRDARLSLG